MTNFTESDHPRAAAGTFTDKTQSAPETQLLTVEQRGHIASNKLFDAGRGIGRNRYGNAAKIEEAYQAAIDYVDQLPEPVSASDEASRIAFRRGVTEFEASKSAMTSEKSRMAQYTAARNLVWVRETHENGAALDDAFIERNLGDRN